ncbi:MAG: TIGR00730 family Rossman fold protein [Gammaproteobacteria bacterium]
MDNLFDRHWELALRAELNGDAPPPIDADNWLNPEERNRLLLDAIRDLIAAGPDRWDIRLTQMALMDMAQGFRKLQPHRHRRKVTVFGSARTPSTSPEYALARDLGKGLAEAGFMVITGAGGGVMAAAHEGAGERDSLGFNIHLPYEQAANPVVAETDHLLSFRFFFVRKLFFAKEADALVVFPGGFGTLDETFELLTLMQTGKTPLVPMLLMDTDASGYWDELLDVVERQLIESGFVSEADRQLLRPCRDVEEAVSQIAGFYRNYHSTRIVDGCVRMRMHIAPEPPALMEMHERWGELTENGFRIESAHDDEGDEPGLNDLHRLVFTFKGRDWSTLVNLIHFINTLR